MDLNALADFHLVAGHGGFGRASRAGRRSKATLSRRIAELEEALGVRLIERNAKGLELTEAGQQLLSRTVGPLHEVTDAIASTREGTGKVAGWLRIAAPILFSQLAMGRLCAEFRARHPDVLVEVAGEDRLVDLVDEQFDAASGLSRNAARERFELVAPAGDEDEVVAAPRQAIGIDRADAFGRAGDEGRAQG